MFHMCLSVLYQYITLDQYLNQSVVESCFDPITFIACIEHMENNKNESKFYVKATWRHGKSFVVRSESLLSSHLDFPLRLPIVSSSEPIIREYDSSAKIGRCFNFLAAGVCRKSKSRPDVCPQDQLNLHDRFNWFHPNIISPNNRHLFKVKRRSEASNSKTFSISLPNMLAINYNVSLEVSNRKPSTLIAIC